MDEVETNQNQSTTMRRVQTTLDDGNKMQVSLKKQDVWGLCAYDFKTMCHNIIRLKISNENSRKNT